MSASPAQVANDLALQAQYFDRRDDAVARACRDCARLIRAFIAGDRVDGRTYGDLVGRLVGEMDRYRNRSETQIGKSLRRGFYTLQAVHASVPR